MALIPASLPRGTTLFGMLALAANGAALLLAQQSPAAAALTLLAYAVAILSFVRPGAVLCGAVFGVIVSADLLDLVATVPSMSFAGVEIGVTDIFLAAMLLAWAGWEVRRTQPGPPLALLAREPAVVAFVPLMLLAAYDLGRGGPGTLSSARIFAYCIAVPLAFRVVEGRRELAALMWSIIAAAVVTALVAGAMLAAGRNVTQSGLSTGGTRALSIGASFLVAAALLALLGIVTARTRLRTSLAEAAVVLVLVGGVAASGSRETWLGLLAALVLYVVATGLHGVARVSLAFGLAAALAAGVYAVVPRPPGVAEQLAAMEHRLSSIQPSTANEDPSVIVRYQKWAVVWQQARAHPVLGTGFGYPATYTANIGGNNFVRSYVDDPENTHLWLLARMGAVGFTAWAAFNAIVLVSALALARRARNVSARASALWAAGILPLIWSGMVFSPVSAFSSTLLLYWFGVALLPVARRLELQARHQENIVVERRNSSW